MLILLILSLLSGGGHIFAEYHKNYPLIYTLKPLTLLLIIMAVLAQAPASSYSGLIIAGLAWSMLGDIFLMLRQQKFIAGLVSFLVAHLLYSYAFYQQLTSAPALLPLSYFVVPALLYFAYLFSSLGKLKAPVLFYVSAIVMMAYFSLALYLSQPTTYSLAAFIGAVLFMLSDASLALNKFKKPFKAAQLVILSTYYLAQWAIAYSCFGAL